MPKRVRLLTPARPAWAGSGRCGVRAAARLGAAALPVARAADHRSGRDRRLRAVRAGLVALPDKWTGPPEVRDARAQIERQAGGVTRADQDRPGRPDGSTGRAGSPHRDRHDRTLPERPVLRRSTSTTRTGTGSWVRWPPNCSRPSRMSRPRTGGSELGRDSGYATPKVDVRGALVDEQERILLMRERSDGRWSLPGGWADPLDTPVAGGGAGDPGGNRIRRAGRQTGRVLGPGHPGAPAARCRSRSTSCSSCARRPGEVRPPDALETLDVGWFGLDELPELSTGRINARQLGRIVAHHRDPLLPTEFD